MLIIEDLGDATLEERLKQTGAGETRRWYEKAVDLLASLQNRATEQADHSARSLAELIDRFAAQREDFIQRLGSLDDATCSRAILHPRLQVPMRPVDMAYFTAEHDDHHLASMRTLVGTTK